MLRRALVAVLTPDRHGDENNEYHIRSLYFDSFLDHALVEKVSGTANRDKYRIRIYNCSDALIRMECKSKINNFISKRSTPITRDLCEQLIACDPTGLENTSSGLLRDMFREMRLRLMQPVVIVDYVREAYVHPAEEIRITFDKQLRSGMGQTDLFNPMLPVIPPFRDPDQMILEVKFNTVMPPYISHLLSSCVGWACRSAISKYVICRQHEGKEF